MVLEGVLQAGRLRAGPSGGRGAVGMLLALCCLVFAVGCDHGRAQRKKAAADSGGVTDIAIGMTVIQSGAKRLGINLGGQDYYDSGQMLRDLTFNNPGFEGGTWQSILRCKVVSASSCRDANQWAQWPADFLKGAQFEVISGDASGSTGAIVSSLAADSSVGDKGVTIVFAPMSKALAAGDFVVVRQTMPGDAQTGWWTGVNGGAVLSTEFHDLAPDSPGRQALRVAASGPGQSASVSSYFDSMAGHSFVQLKGPYRLAFRAKSVGGSKQVKVLLRRQAEHGASFLDKDVKLSDQWRAYSLDFVAAEDGSTVGTVALTFDVSGAEVLLDDVSLTSTRRSATNPTAFRDEVVDTLRELRPGILRYNDGDHLGSSIDNLIAVPGARVRAGFTEEAMVQGMVPLGLHEFLQLCQTIGAEPWFVMPPGMSGGGDAELDRVPGGTGHDPLRCEARGAGAGCALVDGLSGDPPGVRKRGVEWRDVSRGSDAGCGGLRGQSEGDLHGRAQRCRVCAGSLRPGDRELRADSGVDQA